MPDEISNVTPTTETTNTAEPTAPPAAGAEAAPPAASGGDGAATSFRDAVAKAIAETDDGARGEPAADAGDAAKPDADAGADPDDDAGDGGKPDAAPEDGADPDLKAPEGISEKARQRFDTLVDRIKARDAEYTALDGKFKGIEETLRGTGASAEQWGRVLTVMKYANSGDQQQARQALEILDGYRAEIAAFAGVPVQGVDVLGDFPDLRDGVGSGDIPEAIAAELAASRRAAARNRTQASEKQTAEQAQAQLLERQTTARAQLSTLGATLEKSDVDFQRKVEILNKRGVIQNIVNTVQPEQWQQSFRAAYDALGDVTASLRQPAPKPDQQPMRRGGKSGSGSEAQPKSIAEAVRMAVAEE